MVRSRSLTAARHSRRRAALADVAGVENLEGLFGGFEAQGGVDRLHPAVMALRSFQEA